MTEDPSPVVLYAEEVLDVPRLGSPAADRLVEPHLVPTAGVLCDIEVDTPFTSKSTPLLRRSRRHFASKSRVNALGNYIFFPGSHMDIHLRYFDIRKWF